MSVADLETTLNARREQREAAYRELVKRVAACIEVDASEAEYILDVAGKSPKDLSNDVWEIENRKAQLAKLRKYADLVAEKAEVDAAYASGKAAADAAYNEALAKLQTLVDRHQKINFGLMGENWESVKHELFKDCPDGELRAEFNELSREIVRLNSQLRQIEATFQIARTNFENARMAKGGFSTEDINALGAKAQTLEAQIKSLRDAAHAKALEQSAVYVRMTEAA